MYSRFTAGDTFSLTLSPAAYPAGSGWELKLRLVPRTAGDAIEVTSTASGDSHDLDATAAATAGWAPGEYGWVIWAELADASHTIETGAITVLPDPRTAAGPLDMRSEAEIALAEARAAFRAWKPTAKSYKINNREQVFNSADEIISVISYWEGQVQREQNAAGMAAGRASKRRIHVRCGRV